MDDDIPDLFQWVQTVTTDQLPQPPFVLRPGLTVCDPAGWLAVIQTQARDGPNARRAKIGDLQKDLRFIERIVKKNGTATATKAESNRS